MYLSFHCALVRELESDDNVTYCRKLTFCERNYNRWKLN